MILERQRGTLKVVGHSESGRNEPLFTVVATLSSSLLTPRQSQRKVDAVAAAGHRERQVIKTEHGVGVLTDVAHLKPWHPQSR